MKILLKILIAAIFCITSGCSRRNEPDRAVNVASDDAAMNSAIARAKATSGAFVQAFHADRQDTHEFYVKKPYRTPSGGQEHMWIRVTDEHGGVLQGVVANDAESTHEVKLGQQVSLVISEISDWKYQEGKKLIGGFTIRYFIDRLSPQEREAFLKDAGFEL